MINCGKVRSYSSEEVVKILRRVRDSGADLTTFTESELRDIASEAGLNPDDVGSAALALRRDRAIEKGVAEIVNRRKATWWNALSSYIVINSGLAVIDWLGGPSWWVHWVLIGWGMAIVLGAQRAFFPNRQLLEQRAGKKYDRERAREEREAAKRKPLNAPRAFVDAIDEMAARFVHAASDKVEDAIRSGARVRVDNSEDSGEEDERKARKTKQGFS